MLSRAQNTFHHNPRLRGPVSSNFLNLKEGCTGSSESTHVKMPHCWKSHVTAPILSDFLP